MSLRSILATEGLIRVGGSKPLIKNKMFSEAADFLLAAEGILPRNRTAATYMDENRKSFEFEGKLLMNLLNSPEGQRWARLQDGDWRDIVKGKKPVPASLALIDHPLAKKLKSALPKAPKETGPPEMGRDKWFKMKDALREKVWNAGYKNGNDKGLAIEAYFNDGVGLHPDDAYDAFEAYTAVQMADFDPKLSKEYDSLMSRMPYGVSQRDVFDAGDNFRDALYEGLVDAWKKINNNTKEMARLMYEKAVRKTPNAKETAAIAALLDAGRVEKAIELVTSMKG